MDQERGVMESVVHPVHAPPRQAPNEITLVPHGVGRVVEPMEADSILLKK